MNGWKIGIIGVGMVGSQLKRWFEENGCERNRDLFLRDIDPKKDYFDEVNKADVIFITVPTPRCDDKNGSCDLVNIVTTFGMIDEWTPKIVVIKSTVPPGTTEFFQRMLPDWKILFNPEFLTEKRAWEDFVKPDRQIVGFTEQSIDAAHIVLSILPKAPFMSPWGLDTYKPIRITATEAEIIKYGGNIHFVRKINFANLLNLICEKLGVNYENVRSGMAADYRIGDSHLDVNHGGYRGFGGYCLPKDLDALIYSLEVLGLREYTEFLKSDRDFNIKLLASQGLAIDDVSKHIYEFKPDDWEDQK